MDKKYFNALVSGYVIYKYDFTNDKKRHIKTTKVMLNFNGSTLYLNSQLFNDKEVGDKITCTIGFNGKDWIVLSLK